MTIHRFLPHRWRSQIEAARHADAIADILETPPIQPRNDGLVLFSMMGTAVLLPYLVAVKSLWHHLRRGRIVILDDGTLTAQDRAVLAHHCGDPELIRLDSVMRGPFPKGGTWERLLTILDRRDSEYWVQLDSDTVTTGPVDEVAGAIARNHSFILLGGHDAEIGVLPTAEIARQLYPEGPGEGHVQRRVESRLGMIPDERGWRYVRGCSGFAGFSAMGPDRRLAAAFLAEMERMIGPADTHIWGTEQITSNFVLANESNQVLLPVDRYPNYWGETLKPDTAFIHFVGTHRHAQGAYVAASRKAIDAIRAAG
ncbi:hypothetical protein GRI97_02655 [Altererythrobacter xixiisoli]|uniref:Uncharacterized protein n=1 Tax=Croceibacterium xixiisoli TaxID=1476466 RepID=A0A6I4TRF6_9SPHN|nr:hypothetical protein [Croceibacterium xixiisoli]MXO97889.1 hypothetical protein [Croceibacterium xixiisoli]